MSKAVTPTQSRTRTALLRAALSVLTVDHTAPLGEIAKRAEVARSTLHRYFPERADLITALTDYANEQVEMVGEKSRIHEGPAVDALVRVALEYFEHWEAVMWNYATASTANRVQEEATLDILVSQRIAEAQKSGEIDNSMPGEWFQYTMFAIVYSAWEYEGAGNAHTQAAMMVMASMRKLLSPVGTYVVPPVTTG